LNHESAFAEISATRPTNPGGGTPIKINFQLDGSPLVAGYEQDNVKPLSHCFLEPHARADGGNLDVFEAARGAIQLMNLVRGIKL